MGCNLLIGVCIDFLTLARPLQHLLCKEILIWSSSRGGPTCVATRSSWEISFGKNVSAVVDYFRVSAVDYIRLRDG